MALRATPESPDSPRLEESTFAPTQTKVAKAVVDILDGKTPNKYTARIGETRVDLARFFNIYLPPSLLFEVKPGEEWELVQERFLTNPKTGAFFPVLPIV